MGHYSISAIGRDRPGIAAAISRELLALRGNIEDSHMSILRGHFAVNLVVSVPPEVERAEVEGKLTALVEELGLEAVAVNPVDDLHGTEPRPTHVLTVYGSDHPGIVHAVCAALAERSVNITDLQTKLSGEESNPLYVMMLELEVSGEVDRGALEEALRAVGAAAEVEISLRELEAEAL